MKISIITATYNSASTIQKTLESIASQTHKDIEHIIIDGGSTDETLDIIEQYKTNIAIVVSEKDNGIYDAFNKGCSLAHGDIIGFLSSDDTYADSQVLAKMVSAFTDKQCDVLYGDLVYQSSNGKNKRHWESNAYNPNSLKYGWMPPHPTLYCKKRVYDVVGKFDTQFNISGDYDFILRMFSEPTFTFYYLPIVIVHMSTGGASNGSLNKIYQKSREDWKIIHKNQLGGIITLLAKNLRKVTQLI